MILDSGSDYPRFHRYQRVREPVSTSTTVWPEQDEQDNGTTISSCDYYDYYYISAPTLVADVEEEELIPQSIWLSPPILTWKGSRSAFRKFEIIRIRSPTK